MSEFKNLEEFTKVWYQFEKEFQRERWRMPRVTFAEESWPRYIRTRRFQWIAETFKLWRAYRKKYLISKNP